MIAANLAITGFFGWKWSLWSVPAWLEVQQSKAVFLLTLYDSINDMKQFRTVCITHQPCHSHFCCWLLTIWPKLDVWAENGAYGLFRLGWRYNGAKLYFSWPYMIVSMIWNTYETVSITPQPCHSHFYCWWLPIWPKLDVYTINDMKHLRYLHTTPHHALFCFHPYKKVCLRYNLQYTKCIPCTKNIWMIFEYHEDNHEWIFIHQIFLELVPQRIFTFWILLCWTLVAIRAINMHTDISK